MGRDPVELAKRAKYKPPAMRVRDVGYTKKSPFRYKIRLFKPIYNERKGDTVKESRGQPTNGAL